ncbi:MAG TPA: hypothetical protein GXZ61_00145 [Clostridiales bacterium]|jgi:uncharacterized protein YrrD|nr:hypothetical protein [Clostridiales bacterium]
MKQTKQVLGLPVMGMKEGVTQGIAVDFVIDAEAKKVRYIILKNEIGYGFRVLAVEDIAGIGTDYIMTSTVQNVKKLFDSPELLQEMEAALYGSDILGAKVLSVVGNVLPNVKEMVFDEKTGDIDSLILANGKDYLASVIATLARDVVFLDIMEQPDPDFYFEPEVEAVEETKLEEVKPVEAKPAEVKAEAVEEKAEEAPEKPELSAYAKAQREFLLGHKVVLDIIDKHGKVVIAQGTVVTDEVIEYAEKMDVSADLALNVD